MLSQLEQDLIITNLTEPMGFTEIEVGNAKLYVVLRPDSRRVVAVILWHPILNKWGGWGYQEYDNSFKGWRASNIWDQRCLNEVRYWFKDVLYKATWKQIEYAVIKINPNRFR